MKTTTLAEYPHLLNSVLTLCFMNNAPATSKGLKAKTAPEHWRQQFETAEQQLRRLEGKLLGDIIPAYQGDYFNPTDYALDILLDGENDMRIALVNAADCSTLDEVLESFFDGELSVYYFGGE